MTEEEWRWTEEEWLTSDDPEIMLRGLDGLADQLGMRLSERKLRLFIVACVRRIWHVFKDERSRRVVEAAERFADGRISGDDLLRIETQTVDPPNEDQPDRTVDDLSPSACAWEAVSFACERASFGGCEAHSAAGWARDATYEPTDPFDPVEGRLRRECYDQPEAKAQIALLRDIFGNPFRPVAVDPSWLAWNDGTVVKLAQGIYDDRGFDRLPVLADALEEAGCYELDILRHCRQPGEHVRGCWVVDLLLEKD